MDTNGFFDANVKGESASVVDSAAWVKQQTIARSSPSSCGRVVRRRGPSKSACLPAAVGEPPGSAVKR
tara:strand:+ start:1259 stop:1462 length:204 start_codon:yes stop_codon:yes gene_type:complete